MKSICQDFKWEVAVIAMIVVGSYLNAAYILFSGGNYDF
jgi:hypothetical protein